MNIIQLDKFYDERGQLYVIDDLSKFLLKVNRFYFINFPFKNTKRGFHAHKRLSQIIFTIKGTLEIFTENQNSKKIIKLSLGDGLLINKPSWREINPLENESILGCICSESYDPDDYIREYNLFKSYLK